MKFSILLAAIAVLPMLSPATASPPHTANVAAMTANADLVIVVNVERFKFVPATPGSTSGNETFDVRPVRVLKGVPGPRAILSVTSTVSLSEGGFGVENGRYGIFYLIPESAGLYRPVDPHIAYTIAYPGERPQDGEGAAPLARVAAELAAVFTLPPALASDRALGIWPVAPEFRPDYPGEDVYIDAHRALESVDPTVAIAALDPVIAAAPLPGKLWASLIALQLGETSRLQSVSPVAMTALADEPTLATYIYFALVGAKFDATAIPQLGQLLESKNARVREAAFDAFAHMESPASVPVLAAALDGPYADTGHKVVGLICFEINACSSAEQRSYYAKPENHAKLRGLIRKWEKSRNG